MGSVNTKRKKSTKSEQKAKKAKRSQQSKQATSAPQIAVPAPQQMSAAEAAQMMGGPSATKPADVQNVLARAGDKRIVLHVGCGMPNPKKLHKTFQTPDWHEVRFDIDKDVHPDILGDMTDMSVLPDNSVDAIFSSHNLEHLFAHQVAGALSEFNRVLKDGGFLLITMPDIETVAGYVARGQLEEELYRSPAGPISPLDILYGFGRAIANGNHFMAHKTGFTAKSLGGKMRACGFTNITVSREGYDLWAIGYSYPFDHPDRVEKVIVRQQKPDDKGNLPPVPNTAPQPHPGALAPNVATDELDIPPVHWEPLHLSTK